MNDELSASPDTSIEAMPLPRSTDTPFAERIRAAMVELNAQVEVDPRKCGGVPVVRGTRYSVAHLFAELADGHSVNEIAEEFDLPLDSMRGLLQAMAVVVDRAAEA